jgi:asparagine synthetase B (glutamine-hydrolysing)
LQHVRYDIWATSLAVPQQGLLENRLSGGTADFAVSFEGDDLVITTDPLGTCPLWYARLADAWVVSPEAKAIAAVTRVTLRPEQDLLAAGPREPAWTPFVELMRVPPGCSLRLSAEQAVTEGACAVFRLGTEDDSAEDWSQRLGEALVQALPRDSLGPDALREATGALVSGGIDSAWACALARRQGQVATFTLGTDYGDEFEGARTLAQALDTQHHEEQLQRSVVRSEFQSVVEQNEVFDGLTAEILLQLSALYGAARGHCSHVVTGYGSDLLFDGMLKHAAYMDAVGLEITTELIERTRWTGELSPFVHWSRGIAVTHVFWNPVVIEAALRIPRRLCCVDGIEKHVLREAAVRVGLLDRQLAFRPKLGMTDGTGANRLLSEELGLATPHGYRDKSLVCIESLSGVLGSSSSPA